MTVFPDYTATANALRDQQKPQITPLGFLLTLQAAKIEAWIYNHDHIGLDYPFECWVDPKGYHAARRLARRYFAPWMFNILPLEFPS